MGFLDNVKLGKKEQEVTQSFAERIQKLADETGMKVQASNENNVKAVFGLENDRSQQVHFAPAGKIGDRPIVRIYSPVANLDEHPLTSESAQQLLTASSQMLLGAFAITSNWLVVQQDMLLNELTAREMRDVAEVVTKLADDAERDLTGQDKL